ncbi:hypothetical protein U1Q18_047501 [Sarracenia purpurea var. burkii]
MDIASFWFDIWCGDEALCTSFLDSFALATDRRVVGANYVRRVSILRHWAKEGCAGLGVGLAPPFGDFGVVEGLAFSSPSGVAIDPETDKKPMEQVIELVVVTVSGVFPYLRDATSLGEG